MDCEFLRARIEATKAMIILYEDAVLQLSTGAVQSYSLNTGQTTQSVTKFDVARLQADIDGLYNRLVTLEARLTGNGTIIAGPAW
jgi:hypothetical protein